MEGNRESLNFSIIFIAKLKVLL